MQSIAYHVNFMKDCRSLFYKHAQYTHMAETVIRVAHCGERGGGGSGVGWAEADPVPAIVSPHPIRLLMTLPNIILIISNMKVFVDFEEKQDESCWQSYM